MRVLILHNRYRSEVPSGENEVVDRESAALEQAGHVVERFERHSDDIADWSTGKRALLPVQAVWNRQAYRDVAERLEQFKPDVVHVHNLFPLLSASVLESCHTSGVPVVMTLHQYRLLCIKGAFFRDGQVCHKCLTTGPVAGIWHGCYRNSRLDSIPATASTVFNRRTLRNAVTAFICISAAQQSMLAPAGLPPERTFVKWNLIPHTVAPRTTKDHTVVFVGRLYETKGVPVLMAAWDRFRALNPDSSLRLRIAGSGELDDQVHAWGAERTDVDLLGRLPSSEVGVELSSALAGLVPSSWEEAFGLVVVEAMAAGTAPVVAGHAALVELVRPGVDGEVFKPGDADSLAAVLTRIDHNPEHFTRLGRTARATYEASFDPDRNLERLLEIYRWAIAHPLGQPIKPERAQAPATN